MLRISLIIAIVAGLAAAGLNFYKVREVLNTTITERNAERDAKVQEQTAHSGTKKKLNETEENLAATSKKLEGTEATLKKTSESLVASESRGAELATRLEATTAERNTAQQTLSQWEILGVSPEQVKGIMGDLKNSKDEIEVITEEKRLLVRNNDRLQNKLNELLGTNDAVALPAGLKGRIIAVDPKYDFVVLDIGEDKGVLERGEMLINRNGKLVGKIRIAAVQANQSIANVLPTWKQDEVQEGDQVLY